MSFSKTERKNIRVDVKKIADSTGECKFYPLVGNARLKKCHYKCTALVALVAISYGCWELLHKRD